MASDPKNPAEMAKVQPDFVISFSPAHIAAPKATAEKAESLAESIREWIWLFIRKDREVEKEELRAKVYTLQAQLQLPENQRLLEIERLEAENAALRAQMAANDQRLEVSMNQVDRLQDQLNALRKKIELGDRMAEATKDIDGLLCDISQIFDGWHADGTAWSEWDESVRQRITSTHREVVSGVAEWRKS